MPFAVEPMARHACPKRLAVACAAIALLGATVAVSARMAEAASISVAATVESNDATVGTPFALSIAVDGAQNVAVPQVAVDGFRIDYLGPSTQVSLVNGKMSASVTHRYRVIPEREGQFTLGPFAVEYEGQRYETAPIPIKVASAAQAQRGQVVPPGGVQNLRLTLAPAKGEVYAGERIDVTVTLYVGNIRIRDLQYPVVTGDGVTVGKFGQPQETSEVIGGRRYQVVRLKTTLTPLRPGPIDLQATMTMQVYTNRRGGDQFFDSFFGGDAKPVELRAEPAALTVLPLPEQGRPADFSGAIGQFDFTLAANPTELTAGDPITVRMEVSGQGDLAALTPPALPADDQFRRYDAQPAKSEEGGDRRVFEQVVIPKQAGIAALPAVRFSYFDPEARAYRTVTRGPVPLTVTAAAPAQGHVLDAAGPAPTPVAPAAALGRDIVFIKDAPGGLQPRGGALYRRGWFVALQLVPPLLFAAAFAYVRRRDRLASDPRLVRFRAAGREARRALAALRARPAGDPQFYDALAGAMSAYLSAKLDLPPGGVERERVAARLAANGCDRDLGERAGTLFELIDRARYAPSGDAAAERATAVQLAEAIVGGLERARGLDRRLTAGVTAVLLAVALQGGVRADEATPQTAFFQGNQAYAAGNYGEAVRAYRQALAAGDESGALYFNLANALFKNGEVGPAIANYERARRLLPRDPDVEANLSYARDQAGVRVEAAPIWKRLGFPFAARANGSELALWASLSWWAFWGALIVRLLVPAARVAAGRAAAAIAVVYALLAGSLGLWLAEVELRDAAVVTARGETPVRFEPSANGTEHFKAAEGTTLEVTEERSDWLQVRRDDGRRGWIPSNAVERF